MCLLFWARPSLEASPAKLPLFGGYSLETLPTFSGPGKQKAIFLPACTDSFLWAG